MSGAARPVPPMRNSERALIARQHTTTSAAPVATAIAAWREHLVGAAAAAEQVEVVAQVADAERLRDHDRLHGVADAVAGDAVDVGDRQPGVVERGPDRPQRQRERADARVLRVRRGPDADDRGPVAHGDPEAPVQVDRSRAQMP